MKSYRKQPKVSVRGSALVMVVLFSLVGVRAAYATTPAPCTMRLALALTPDVPHPSDTSFLSSLLSNETDYELAWVRQTNPSDIVVDLRGPGPADQCRRVVETMLRDGRVLSIQPDTDEMSSVAVTADRAHSDLHISRSGLGAIYWAARHPAQGWKILLPASPEDPAYADERWARNTLATDSPIASTVKDVP